MGTNQQDHLSNLNQVLNRLMTAGLTAQKTKCTFETTSIEYLGHVIDSTRLHPSPKKSEVIACVPEPTNVTELK